MGGAGQPPAVRVLACPAGGVCGDVVFGRRWTWSAPGRVFPVAPLRGAGQSLSCLGVGAAHLLVVLLTGGIGPGELVDRVGSGQAEFSGPALDERP